MAMGGVHAMLHEDGVPRPCPTCPVQSMQQLLQLTAEFSGTDKLVLTKKGHLISDWASWSRGTTHRRRIKRQGVSDFLEQNPGYTGDGC